jgi:hypothetical protein
MPVRWKKIADNEGALYGCFREQMDMPLVGAAGPRPIGPAREIMARLAPRWLKDEKNRGVVRVAAHGGGDGAVGVENGLFAYRID